MKTTVKSSSFILVDIQCMGKWE